MARAPPTDDAEPEIIEFGIPVLDDRVEAADIEFPTDRQEVESLLGDIEVPFDANGHSVTLSEALDHLDQTEFASKHDLLDAMHPVFEDYRQRTSTGLLGMVRSILPF